MEHSIWSDGGAEVHSHFHRADREPVRCTDWSSRIWAQNGDSAFGILPWGYRQNPENPNIYVPSYIAYKHIKVFSVFSEDTVYYSCTLGEGGKVLLADSDFQLQ